MTVEIGTYAAKTQWPALLRQVKAGKRFTDTLQLARRYKRSAYDASYLELALRSGLALATLDEDLQKAAKKARVKAFG